MKAPFAVTRVLDRGSRPDWSPNGDKLAFTESDLRDTPGYELDLATKKVRCLTCHLGPVREVTRIYYLPDGSFLLLAPNLDHPTKNVSYGQELFWMPADLGPAQRLDAPAFGEIAISSTLEKDGSVVLGWGDASTEKSFLWTGRLTHDHDKVAIVDRKKVVDVDAPGTPASFTVLEAYGLAHDNKALTFYTVEEKNGTLDDDMFEVDIGSGVITPLYRDPAHTETHLLQDERYGLEESNRASDPGGAWRGISSHPAAMMGFLATQVKMSLSSPASLADYAPHGKLKGFDRPFDLFIVRIDGSEAPRRLTEFSELGATTHQSVVGRDPRKIAFAVDPRTSPEMAKKGGLYVGIFGTER